jgi:iron complex transport system substrate-binding protein
MQKKDALDAVKKRFGWENISAVRNGRVYNDIDPDVILRQGPRIVDGLVEMHKRFHPQ